MRAVLLVDGYNVIHACEPLAALMSAGRAEEARRSLIAGLAEYAAASGESVTVVFDAHHRERGRGDAEVVDGVSVLWGSRGQSADQVIERLVMEASRRGGADHVSVATSDRLQREMVMAMGASVVGSTALLARLRSVGEGVGEQAAHRRRSARSARRLEHGLDEATRAALERMRRGLPPT
ncbi:MAG: NYN domain-containing protein [Candidatus Dormibacteria bacterium]